MSILSEARELYFQATCKGGVKTEKLWGWNAPHMKKYWDKTSENLKALIFYAQEEPHIATSRNVFSQAFGFIVEDMISYLKNEGFDLMAAPKEVCESEICSPKVKFEYKGRRLSTDFLYRLAIANSMNSQFELNNIHTVFEIGAGLGTLARCLKILNPKLRYYIVDLPETLLFSYCFLKASFPDLKTKYILSASDFSTINKESFIFIPVHLASQIPKLSIDLVVNTYSLGEMTQKIVLDYMKLMQEQLDREFYLESQHLK